MITHCSQKGMTLIEVIVVTAIYSISLLALSGAIRSVYVYNAYSFAQASEVSEARRGVTALVRDIREMTYGDDGAYPLTVMEDHRIGFFSDIDRDDSVEYVEYEVSDTNLIKEVYSATGSPPVYDFVTPTETYSISTYVQNIAQGTTTFTYYDQSGQPATGGTLVSDIRYIDAKVIVNIDPIRDPGEFMLRSSAALRNVKDNL